jgi:hypothetical protein
MKRMEDGPGDLGPEQEEELKSWMEDVQKRVHRVEDFVAGSFGRHMPVWEELLSESKRPSSKTVLSWLRNGIKSSFVGTEQCDRKKLERVYTPDAKENGRGCKGGRVADG